MRQQPAYLQAAVSSWIVWLGIGGAFPALAEETPTEAEASDEVVVWGDRFLRWERRWHVETEVRLAGPMRLNSCNNDQLDIVFYRLSAVLDCDKDFVLTQVSWEVSCRFEDVGLVVVPLRDTRAATEIVDQIDATLTSARFQLQVNERGGVPNVDLEDVGETRSRRHRQRQEQLRQLISSAIVPFHLKLPPTIRSEMKWIEYDSALLTMPVPYVEDLVTGTMAEQHASRGGTILTHTMAPYAGHLVVQSLGKAIITPDGTSLFNLRMDGVTLFDPDNGIMTERVWSVHGHPTAAGTAPYLHQGRITMLGTDDAPFVETSRVLPTLTGQPSKRANGKDAKPNPSVW